MLRGKGVVVLAALGLVVLPAFVVLVALVVVVNVVTTLDVVVL